MNFELKTLNLSSAAAAKCDLLLLLVPESFKPQQDPLSALVQNAVSHGDWSAATSKQLHLYQTQGVQARRVLLLGVGKGTVRDLRSALSSAASVFKAEGVKHAIVCLSALDDVNEAGNTERQKPDRRDRPKHDGDLCSAEALDGK